ncbi:hypothetical protein ACOSQ3_019598 [Xanthoceras sorbifolium]
MLLLSFLLAEFSHTYCFKLGDFVRYINFSSFYLRTKIELLNKDRINAAAKERDVAIREKDAVAKERDALRKRVAALKAEKVAISAEKEETISSPAFDGFMHQEYVNEMKEIHAFFKDDVAPKLLQKLEKAILENEKDRKGDLGQEEELPILDMHKKTPPKDEKSTFFTFGKEGTLIIGARLAKGSMHNFDYYSFVYDNDSEEEEVVLTSDDEDIKDEDASTIITLLKKGKCVSLSKEDVG